MIYNSSKKEYKTPTCDVFGMAPRKVVCTSPNGYIDDASEEEYGEF